MPPGGAVVRRLWSFCVSQIGAAEAAFVLVVILGVSIAIISCVTQQYWMTNVLDRWFEVHAFNGPTRLYFEALIWTLLLTVAQFYKYHLSTLSIYDAITIKDAGWRSRWTHHLLQALLSMFTWICVLALAVAIFSALRVLEIMNLYEIDLEKIMAIYIPWLNLDYLVFYFVMIDAVILLMNLNFSACEACDPDRRQEFAWEREGLYWAIFIGALTCVAQLTIMSLATGTRSQYGNSDNITVELGRAAPLLFMIFLQLFYVVTSVRVRAKLGKRLRHEAATPAEA